MEYGKWAIGGFLVALSIITILSGFSNSVGFATLEPQDRISPADHIKESDIHVYKDKVVIELDDARWAKFTDTNSMDPVLDVEANALQVVPTSPDQIHVGDIISYEIDDKVIIHRVISIGSDHDGWFAITKGDNLENPDPYKVRWSWVKKLVVAIIY